MLCESNSALKRSHVKHMACDVYRKGQIIRAGAVTWMVKMSWTFFC